MNDKYDHSWRSKRFGTKLGHQFFYFMVKIGGRRLAYFFLYVVVLYYTFFISSVTKMTHPYLSRRFPNASVFKRAMYRYFLILNLGKVLIDRSIVGILGGTYVNASFRTSCDLKKIKSLDTGFILLMSHVGCWQVAMSALRSFEKPVNLLMLRTEKDLNKHSFEYGRSKDNLKVINPQQFLGGSIEMLNALKNDEILCIMGDRIFGNKELSIEMCFLNGKTRFPISAYKLASITQKPIVVLHSHKAGPAEYKISVSNIVHVPAKLGKSNEKFRPYAEKYVDSLELFTTDHPYQFFNFYDMWDL